eukprot:UN25906
MRLEESTVKTVFSKYFLKNYENTVLDYKKRSKHAINIISKNSDHDIMEILISIFHFLM